jgi:hypothetical protein
VLVERGASAKPLHEHASSASAIEQARVENVMRHLWPRAARITAKSASMPFDECRRAIFRAALYYPLRALRPSPVVRQQTPRSAKIAKGFCCG